MLVYRKINKVTILPTYITNLTKFVIYVG